MQRIRRARERRARSSDCKKPSGGVGGAAAPLTFIRVSRLCRLRGSLILLAKSIPYNFGRPLVGRSCFLEKVGSSTFSTRCAGPLTWIMPAARLLHFIGGDNSSSRDEPPESDGNLPFHIRNWRRYRSKWLRIHPLSFQPPLRLVRWLWATPSNRIHQIGWHRDEIHNADNTLTALCRPPFRGSLRFRFQLMLTPLQMSISTRPTGGP